MERMTVIVKNVFADKTKTGGICYALLGTDADSGEKVRLSTFNNELGKKLQAYGSGDAVKVLYEYDRSGRYRNLTGIEGGTTAETTTTSNAQPAAYTQSKASQFRSVEQLIASDALEKAINTVGNYHAASESDELVDLAAFTQSVIDIYETWLPILKCEKPSGVSDVAQDNTARDEETPF